LQTQLTGEYANDDIPIPDILELDETLNGLEAIDPIYVKLFEARVFAGMTIEETAQVLELSASSVKRKWKVAVAWIKEHNTDH